jgi:hypothetical protein
MHQDDDATTTVHRHLSAYRADGSLEKSQEQTTRSKLWHVYLQAQIGGEGGVCVSNGVLGIIPS